MASVMFRDEHFFFVIYRESNILHHLEILHLKQYSENIVIF